MLDSTEIAKLAGVSRSTVSKVLNNYPNISAETREKVLEIVRKNNYVPNSNAQALAGKVNSVIGIFIYEKNYQDSIKTNQGKNFVYFTDFIDACMKESFVYKHQILVDVIEDKIGEARVETFFKNGSIAGGIFIGLNQESSFIKKLMEKDYRLALIDYRKDLDGHKKNSSTFLINVKDYEGSYEVTKRLIDSGCKKILYIAGDEKKLTGSERKNGYTQCLKDNNIEIQEELIISSNFKKDDSYFKIKEFLEKNIEFHGVISANDTMAYSFLDVVEELGLKERFKDIPIWGYDNLKYSFIQGIKTVAPNFSQGAVEAIKSLIVEGYGKETPQKIEVKLIEKLEDYLNS
ncbi:LacI family DNA-binding transcriptional regulator [Cetobacterium somerae]|uniref:LacI family DNA-binding transcriptional regulator n=1 Tax=Cetobacterium somerae TaxID=188913 RepID=UPI00211F16FA|nr:LacI family DNA-binding transcriptional regulator [Cetobacterium somerae]MCQ9627927.1 LacI family DNA-binding transcriptional regulator [Cetobacterium somerae]